MCRLKIAKPLIFIATLLCIASASISIAAQTNAPQLVDEFGKLSDGTLQAHLDNVWNRLNNDPKKTAQFLISRGEKLPIGTAKRNFEIMREYLIYQKIDPSRIIPTICRPQAEENVQIWIVSTTGERKTCEPDLIRIEQTILFDAAPAPDNYSGSASRVQELRSDSLKLALDSYAEQLRSNPDANGYLIIYGGTNVSRNGDADGALGTVRKLDAKARIRNLTVTSANILKMNGLPRNRFFIRESGYRDSYAQIELWIVPTGGEKPTPSRTYPKVKVNADQQF